MTGDKFTTYDRTQIVVEISSGFNRTRLVQLDVTMVSDKMRICLVNMFLVSTINDGRP